MMATPPDLPNRLRLVVTRLARRLRQQAEAPVSPTQAAVLGTIDRLERHDLVARRRDAEDRRVIRVEITDAGRALLSDVRTRKRAYLEEQLATLSPRDRATLERAASI